MKRFLKTKHIVSMMVLMVAVLLTSSCTKNNGNIGDIFGMWQIQSIQVNDQDATPTTKTLYLSFQSNALLLRGANDSKRTDEVYGSFVHEGDNIQLIFDIGGWTPPTSSHLTKGVNDGKIQTLTGKDFIFTVVNGNSETVRFVCKKWN